MEWMEQDIDLHLFTKQQAYQPMWELQKQWVKEVDSQLRKQSLLLLEHQHVYTFGRGAHKEHLLISEDVCREKGIELEDVDRGGDITYHGPGQLVGYPIIHLDRFKNDTHIYLRKLEECIINTLAHFGIEAARKSKYTGVWVQDEKVAAIGVKFNKANNSKGFITSHGLALNINTDLHMFDYIVPCGIREYGVTSMTKLLGHTCPMEEVREVFYLQFMKEFNFTYSSKNNY